MSFVMLESPYSGEIQRNIAYAQRAMNDSRKRNESSFISHLLWTQHPEAVEHFVCDYNERYRIPELGRDLALEQLKCVRRKVDKVIFLVDYGYSAGMIHGLQQCKAENIPWEERSLGDIHLDDENAKLRS